MQRFKIVLFTIVVLFITLQAAGADQAPVTQSFTVNDAIALALKNSASLEAAKANLEAARKELAAAAKTLRINLEPYEITNVEYNSTSVKQTIFGGRIVFNPNWEITVSSVENDLNSAGNDSQRAQIVYSPFNFTKAIDLRTKEVNLYNQASAYESARVGLIIEVRSKYAEALKSEALYRLALEDLDLAGSQLKLTESLFNAGKSPRLDYLEARQQAKAAEVKKTSAQYIKEISYIKLAALLGLDSLEGKTLCEEGLNWSNYESINTQASIEACLKESPEVKEKQAAFKLTKTTVNAAAFVNLLGLQITAGARREKDTTPGQDTTSYSLGVRVPLYDQSAYTQLEVAKQKYKAAEASLSAYQKDTPVKIKEALNLWKTTAMSLNPAADAVETAKERLRITNLKFESGLAGGFEIIQARQGLAAAEESYWEAWQAMQTAREQFFQVVWGNPIFNEIAGNEGKK